MEILNDGMVEFVSGIKSERTKELYNHYLNRFLEITELETPEMLLSTGKKDPQKLSTMIIYVIQGLKEGRIKGVNGEKLGSSSVHGIFKAIKHYCVMNDIILNWDKLGKILPSQSKADDRAITRDEILKLLQYSNLQTRSMVLFMASGGMRIGALSNLTFRDLEPMLDKGQLLACKVVIYRGTPDEYYTFITLEAYRTIKEYLAYSERSGERIHNDTKLFKLTYHGMRLAMFRLVKKAGIERSKKGKRYEFPVSHALRKFYKSICEQYMKSLVVEILIGHSVGVTDSYYKPTTEELLQEYLKAGPTLTFSEGRAEQSRYPQMQEQLRELAEGMVHRQFENLSRRMDAIEKLLKEHQVRA